MSNPWSQAYEELRKPYYEGKMAKKDYDGDGKIESGTDEYKGSVDKAIKKSMAEKGKKKVSEHHTKDADGKVIEHGDGTPSSVEEEQINELSKKTLGSYVKKSALDIANRGVKLDKNKTDDDDKKSKKRLKGIVKATNKLTKEDAEQLDELSKKTLGGYIKKASKETRGNMVATQHGSGIPKKAKDIKLKQVNKRLKGMEKAGEKLAKEEVKMSRKEYSKIHKDFKSDDPKNPRTTKYVKGKGTVSMPVKFTDEFQHIEYNPLAEGTLGTLHVADMAGNTLAWQNRMDTNEKGERLYDFGQDLINAMAEFVDEAKVDKLVPDHKRSGKRLERYGNPHGSLALGGGIQRDRRADHAERRGKKTKGMKKEDWRSDLQYIEEISPAGEPTKSLKKGEKVDGKEGSVNNKITINPNVQVESTEVNEIAPAIAIGGALGIAAGGTYIANKLRQQKNKIDKGIKVDGLAGRFQQKNQTLQQLQNNSHEPEGEMVENSLINKIKNDFNIVSKAKNVVGAYNKKLQQNNNAINQVLPGTASMQNNSYEPESEMVEDAKMARQSDDALSAAHKKFSGMDQTSPANKFMLKRISKEINRRKKKVNEELNRNQKPFYQKKYTTGGYKTVGTNKRMNSSSDRKKAGTVDSKASHRDQMKDFADAGIIKKGKSGGGMKKGLASLKKESLLDQVASAYVDEATRMKKEMGYDKGGTKKPKGPKTKDAALDAVKKSITAKYGKGAIMRSGSNQPKKVKGQKPSGGGKFKMMADKKKETAADAKKRGFKNTKDYVNTMARYGGKDNYDKGKGLGT